MWFAFKLVSLNHWKQHGGFSTYPLHVVICFQISIFEPLETTELSCLCALCALWFAFKLVSLNHWKQQKKPGFWNGYVVICFQISIFEPLETTTILRTRKHTQLWFAFKLVSLNHWKQPVETACRWWVCCDLLSN